MPTSSSESFEAVFLFQGEQIARELLYPEFEAILDGFIPMPDFADSAAKVAYVRINSALQITGAVFFLLGFDDKGMIDRRWNVPLQRLLEEGGPGPDMGAGPIRLACYSQCSIAWHQENLWDPYMQPGRNSFVAMRKSIQANRLGFIVKAKSVSAKEQQVAAVPTGLRTVEEYEREQAALQQKLHDHYTQEMRDKVALTIKEQRLRVTTLMNQHQAKLHDMQHDHQQRLQAYQQKMREIDQYNKDLAERNRSLKESLDVHANKIEGMREYFAHKLKAAQQDESSQLQALQENFALEMDVKIQAATAELREMLDMREVELFYRHQNESALKEEIVKLKRENQVFIKHSGDQLLSRLAKTGISFISFMPGVGQVDIPLDDMSRYLENPQGFAAEKSGVTEPLYLAWFEHHQLPCCNAVDHRGRGCGRPVVAIQTPVEFHPGESDRCEQHQAVSYQLLAERR